MLIRTHNFLSDDDGGGNGGGEPAGGKVRASELRQQLGANVDEQALMRLLEKQAELLSDNSQLREQRRTLRQEVTDLKGKQAPEGARILLADEAPLWDAYTALGKPDDIKRGLEERQASAERLAQRDRQDAIAQAAEAAGYKAGVLAQLAGAQPITVKDEGKDKDRKAVAYIADAEGKEHRLTDYAEKHWTDFLPSLAPKQAGDGVGSPANGKRPARDAADTPRPRVTF